MFCSESVKDVFTKAPVSHKISAFELTDSAVCVCVCVCLILFFLHRSGAQVNACLMLLISSH